MAEFQELIFIHPAGESKLFRSDASPLAIHRVVLAVIIAKLQMLAEVFFRIVQTALCFGGQHPQFLAHPAHESCNEIITT